MSWVGKIPGRRAWQPAPVFLPRKSYGQRSLVDYSPWDCKELNMPEQLAFSPSPYSKMSFPKVPDLAQHFLVK